jgi:hypothetical protein
MPCHVVSCKIYPITLPKVINKKAGLTDTTTYRLGTTKIERKKRKRKKRGRTEL